MKKIYRNIGIGLLIVNVLFLLNGFFKFLMALFILPNFYSFLLEIISVNGQYGIILFYLFMSLNTFLALWGVVLSIILIKNNLYTKQLLFWVYSLIGIKILSFVLYLPLKSYMIMNLMIAILVYIFCIFQDNQLSRVIKNKTK